MKLVYVVMIFMSLLILFELRKNKTHAEQFVNKQFFSEYVNQNTKDGENLIKFCNVLRNIDNQTEGIRLIKKINANMLERGNDEINKLMNQITELQNKDNKKQIENSNYYKLKTHQNAKKQRTILNAVKQRIVEDPVTKVTLK
jgi:hypothetical protein